MGTYIIFEWCVIKRGSHNKHPRNMYSKETKLHSQYLSTIVNIYMHRYLEKSTWLFYYDIISLWKKIGRLWKANWITPTYLRWRLELLKVGTKYHHGVKVGSLLFCKRKGWGSKRSGNRTATIARCSALGFRARTHVDSKEVDIIYSMVVVNWSYSILPPALACTAIPVPPCFVVMFMAQDFSKAQVCLPKPQFVSNSLQFGSILIELSVWVRVWIPAAIWSQPRSTQFLQLIKWWSLTWNWGWVDIGMHGLLIPTFHCVGETSLCMY